MYASSDSPSLLVPDHRTARAQRSMSAVLFAITVLLTGSACARQETVATEVYARADWYLARPEQEQEWRGLLLKRETPLGPATRSALSYTLVTDEGEIPVYAANAEQQLASFVGHQVIVYGKLVDLSDESFGQELWIASIKR